MSLAYKFSVSSNKLRKRTHFKHCQIKKPKHLGIKYQDTIHFYGKI